jgi:hypothetical protein
LTFVLPFAVFMLVGSLEPKPGAADTAIVPYAYYPLVYSIKIALTVAAILFVLPGYRPFLFPVSRWSFFVPGYRRSPLRLSPWAIVAGVAGAVVWVGICHIELETRLLKPLGLGWFVGQGERSAFNPFEQFQGNVAQAWGFLAIRFFGLAVVVAVIEEFFLRGFLMRFVMDARWWEIPFGRVNTIAVLAGTLVPMLTHPAELFAAAAWFSMITLLMVKTRNIWDCVVAHAITNLLLGVYVVASGEWHLM